MITRLTLIALSLMLGGCASNALYRWGGYEDQLYATYKDPSKAQDFRARLQAHVEESQKAGLKVAPGLYAEIATFYLQAGDRQQALRHYQLERQTWPESAHLMTGLIQNLERLEKARQGDKP